MTHQVEIVDFPETKVAVLEHRGAPELEHQTALKLVRWRIENGLRPDRHQSFGIHYTDPYTTPPAEHRVDFCVSIDDDVAPNDYGVMTKIIPNLRCARARHVGSRERNLAAIYLHDEWLPQSDEVADEFPMIFHYVNVGPNIREEEMLTDVYLPLKTKSAGS